jgi:hypothetical protein
MCYRQRNYGWCDLGLGAVGASNWGGFGGTLTVSHLSNLGLFTVRFVRADYYGIYPAIPVYYQLDHLSEFGVLYGRAFNRDYLFASASLGIGVSSAEFKKPQASENFVTIGFPFEAGVFIIPIPVLALGAKVVVNVNNKSTFAGGFLCLRLGILRYVKISNEESILK